MNYLDIYKDQTILVTGGARAIGSNLCSALAETGAAKVVIGDQTLSQSCARLFSRSIFFNLRSTLMNL